ncbi:N-acetyltransferase [Roseomonas mucosa]|uniref:hypothetical protein n=1 Tax=Roseomonas mucosa TaxID=207340 RepID=UPI0022471A87|nr:hypothetical protein [Roseomonas mucosa]UZO94598.1 Phage protein [Roseomonas mucosa]
MAETLRLTRFDAVDLADPFFDSLKQQYGEFPAWFAKKAQAKEPVYVIDKDGGPHIRGFVYLKLEEGPLDDVEPPLPAARRLKVGTLKIVAHGTKLGERVIKKIFDHALRERVAEIYVTVFDTHASLIELFKRYGFEERAKKATPNGVEMVLARTMTATTGDIRKDYPFIHAKGRKFWLLAIYPEYHSNLLPDSLLKTETHDILEDVSHTNAIHKVYIAKLALTRMRKGDVVVTYRTTDIPGRARFRSVATSVCVVEEVRSRGDFASVDEFLKFAQPHSVFTEEELRDWFGAGDRLYAVKMTYNLALPKRPNRDALLEKVGVSEQPRWDLRELTRVQFDKIMELGQANEGIVVD